MKKKHLVAVGAVALLIVFAVGGYAYKRQRTKKIQRMAKTVDSPLMRAHAQTYGPAEAKVVIVEFFDPACETCRLFSKPVKDMVDAYAGRVRLVLRYAPFHDGADTVVKILEAGRLQGKYWETLQVLYDKQSLWASHHSPRPDLIWQFLPAANVDVARLRNDMNDPKILALIQQDIADAKTLGVHKTPGFFVNGKPLVRFGYQQLRSLVSSEVTAQYGR